MSKPLASMLTETVATLLTETYEGAPAESRTWYADSGPQGGLLGLLASIGCADATRAAPGRKSIAQHARHVRFHLEATLRLLNGDRSPNDWDESWIVDARDEAAWKREVGAMQTAYAAIRRKFETIEWTDLTVGSAFGIVAHGAYHMGAIKQLLAK